MVLPFRSDGFRRLMSILLPWGSLVMGVVGAVLMDRSPEQAPTVAILAGSGWFFLSLVLMLGRKIAASLAGEQAAGKIAEFSEVWGTQSLTQLAVFFSFPFYLRATAPSFGQIVFLVLLGGVGLGTLWDPLYEYIADRVVWRRLFRWVAVFAALNCCLPMLGLSNRLSHFVALFAAMWTLRHFVISGSDARHAFSVVRGGLVVAGTGLLATGMPVMVPPAPLSLQEVQVGTQMEGKVLADPTDNLSDVPSHLLCYSRIHAPRGIRDRLVHEWSHEGRSVDRIELEVRGGRKEGFRTWSKKKRLGLDASGRWRCTVKTAMGQVLGSAKVDVAKR